MTQENLCERCWTEKSEENNDDIPEVLGCYYLALCKECKFHGHKFQAKLEG